MTSRQNIVRQLREQLRRLEQASVEDLGPSRPAVSTGVKELDALLPDRGIPRGSLVEWLAAVPGSGAGTLALLAAREALRDGGAFVVCDPAGEFYPSVPQGWGIPLERLVILRPKSRQDLFWACDQALRCPGVAATLCSFERLNDREFRRLQLAAEEGNGLGLLMRPAAARSEATWSEVRWRVEPRTAPTDIQGRWVHIELLRCRGGIDGGALLLEIDDAPHSVRVVPSLAPAAPAHRPRRHRSRAG